MVCAIRRQPIRQGHASPPGVIAWRIITSDDQEDTEGAERVSYNFQSNLVYLWKATWSNRIDLEIKEGGATGRRIYFFGKPFQGVYDPAPHNAYVGSPVGRGGVLDATVPGMVVRQVWISARPRPDFAN